MEQISLSSELYSHPDKLLEVHLVGVARFAEVFLCEKPAELRAKISKILNVSALCHDLGKATKYFQNYIISPDNERLKTEQTQHSFLSACMGLYQALKYMSLFEASLVYLIIKHHHSDLYYTPYDFNVDKGNLELCKDQAYSIDKKKFEHLLYNINHSGFQLDLNLEQFIIWIEKDLPQVLKDLKRIHKKLEKNILNYFVLNTAYSVLLDADKSDVVVEDVQVYTTRKKLSANLVDNYKKKVHFLTTPINSLRQQAYQEIISHDISAEQRIYSINLPTGLGKTLCTLGFALKLREYLGNRHRIVYSLPYLSIIDQNFREFEKVLSTNGIEPKSNIILKHHHLGVIRYEHSDVEEKTEISTDWARILIEGWNSEIIVTTFVQFFHTLVSYQNRSLRKFHRLSNSIIILDEVQSIPIKYWQLIRTLLLKLARELNSYVIFVTATLPMIFEPDEIYNLCNHKQYFERLNRISIVPKIQQSLEIEELSSLFEFSNKSHLLIFNTISSAKKFYKHLIESNFVSESEATFLSTHIVPKHRKERIEKIRKKEFKVVVSTQLVEAGVDIDFDVVIRDIAPFDSIVQSAGRCNRNALNKGEVYVVNLVENGRRIANIIYDPVLIDITEGILKEKFIIEEPEIYCLANQYFQETSKRKSSQESDQFLEAISSLLYDHPDKDSIKIRDFKLIENDYAKIDVFIEVDDEAKNIWQRFNSLAKIKNRFERKNEFDKFRSEFYDYVISVPSFPSNIPISESAIGYVSFDMLDVYYNFKTGYNVKEEISTIIF